MYPKSYRPIRSFVESIPGGRQVQLFRQHRRVVVVKLLPVVGHHLAAAAAAAAADLGRKSVCFTPCGLTEGVVGGGSLFPAVRS
jgi:hypothetical protein